MPNQIQNPPWGFLDLVGSKANGQNPNVVLDQVSTVIDITAFQMARRYQQAFNTQPALSAGGAVSAITVPVGQLWYVFQFGGRAAPNNAGTVVQLALQFTLSASFDRTVLISDPAFPGSMTMGTQDQHRIGFAFPQPFLAPAGSVFEVVLNRPTGGATTLDLVANVLHVPLSA